MFQEQSNEKFKKEFDLFSLGIVLLELDNYDIFDYSKLSIIESLREKGINALSSYNLNSKSLLF